MAEGCARNRHRKARPSAFPRLTGSHAQLHRRPGESGAADASSIQREMRRRSKPASPRAATRSPRPIASPPALRRELWRLASGGWKASGKVRAWGEDGGGPCDVFGLGRQLVESTHACRSLPCGRCIDHPRRGGCRPLATFRQACPCERHGPAARRDRRRRLHLREPPRGRALVRLGAARPRRVRDRGARAPRCWSMPRRRGTASRRRRVRARRPCATRCATTTSTTRQPGPCGSAASASSRTAALRPRGRPSRQPPWRCRSCR